MITEPHSLLTWAGPFKPNDLQPYLELVVHELLLLYFYGVEVTLPQRAPWHGKQVNVKVMLLQWVCDLRGYAGLLCEKQAGANEGACFCCKCQGKHTFQNLFCAT